MVTTINTRDFSHVSEVFYNNKTHRSVYNHNYYVSTNGEIILEECDDDSCFSYYVIDNNSIDFLGIAEDVFGIFDEEYDGYPVRDLNGIIELDSDFC